VPDDAALKEIEGITSAHLKVSDATSYAGVIDHASQTYGPKILSICIKYKPFTALDVVEHSKLAAAPPRNK
jgi:hypothetical protein